MSDKPETLAAILAEMRDDADILVFPTLTPDKLRTYADRIEAAAEREREEHTNDIHDALYMATGIPGNAAALREALEYVLQFDATDEAAEEDGLTDAERIAEYADHIEECQKKARAALAAPPRNCDVGDAAEQSERLAKFCKANFEKAKKDKHICSECRFNDCIGECPLKWAQLPFTPEKGGAE